MKDSVGPGGSCPTRARKMFSLGYGVGMGRKITETREENEGSCRSRGRMSSACPQIYSLGTSVWGGKFIGTPIVCLHFRGSPWTRKLTELPWFSITFGGGHGPEKPWKLKKFHYFQGGPWAKKTIGFQSFPLLSEGSMDQKINWNSMVFRYFRDDPWTRKIFEINYFSITFGKSMDEENDCNCVIFH